MKERMEGRKARKKEKREKYKLRRGREGVLTTNASIISLASKLSWRSSALNCTMCPYPILWHSKPSTLHWAHSGTLLQDPGGGHGVPLQLLWRAGKQADVFPDVFPPSHWPTIRQSPCSAIPIAQKGVLQDLFWGLSNVFWCFTRKLLILNPYNSTHPYY